MRASSPAHLSGARAALAAAALTLALAATAPGAAVATPGAVTTTAAIHEDGCGCQTTSGGRRSLGAAASAAMAVAGIVLLVRRYRQRSRIPGEDQKFGSYRGPKKD